jgi:F-type H+-transporting ATPase subunit gamma
VPTIRDLKKRITSVKNTQQTTKAMKMVSAAKLRRSQDAILSQRPYALEIAKLMSALAGQGAAEGEDAQKKPVSLLVVFSSDRGLCGGYNSSVIRATQNFLNEKATQGKPVKTVFVGKKAYEIIKNRFKLDLVHYEEFGQKITFRKAPELSRKILPLFESGEVDEVIFIFNEFINAMTQEVRTDRVLPLNMNHHQADEPHAQKLSHELTIYHPSKQELYTALSGKYFVIQIFKSLLEAQASEHGARMSAMENATKNAGDMIRKLTLIYNKQRQAMITKELLEIISGSESQKTQA